MIRSYMLPISDAITFCPLLIESVSRWYFILKAHLVFYEETYSRQNKVFEDNKNKTPSELNKKQLDFL